jgi:uncharacterized protein
MRTIALLLFLAFGASAHAQSSAMQGQDPNFKPLPERKDVVSWKTLGQVQLVKQKDRYVPQFDAGIAALDQKQVKVQGFMMPLQTGEKQTHFVLSAMPQSCAFCMPGGPEQMVEVKSKTPVKYSMDAAVVVSGKFMLLKEDPTGVFYRLVDAVPAN